MERVIPACPSGYVLVECVWPAERGAKDDCRGRTGVIWAGNGDVQAYPAALWPKLAEHPGVWRLYTDPVKAAAEVERKQAEERAAATERARVAAEASAAQDDARRRAEGLAAQAAAAREAGAATNTDVVTITTAASATPDVPDEAPAAPSVVSAALEANASIPLPDFPQMAEIQYSEEQLAGMSDTDVRELAKVRGYGMHPRLSSENLRPRFLNYQKARVEGRAAVEAEQQQAA